MPYAQSVADSIVAPAANRSPSRATSPMSPRSRRCMRPRSRIRPARQPRTLRGDLSEIRAARHHGRAMGRIQAVNLRGTMLVMREAIRHMRAARPRRLDRQHLLGQRRARSRLFITRLTARARPALTNLTRVAALEFGSDKIRVNAVLPGGTATEGADSCIKGHGAARPRDERADDTAGPRAARDDGFARRHRGGLPFFASPASKQITGHCLAVDGGFMVS